MTSQIHICFILFVFTGCFFSCAEALGRKYISLISDVHNHYKTSSVFFMIAQHNRGLDEYTVLHLLSREFSQNGVLTLVTNFMELEKLVNLYTKRIHRPLIVVLLKGVEDLKSFNKNTKKSSYPIWLIIFEGKSGNPICRYCDYSTVNVFDLRFDMEMLVMCCEDPILKEWWSNDEKRTEKDDFAIWTEEKGLKLLTTKGLTARRFNLNGKGIRVAIVSNTTGLVQDYGNNTFGGYFGEILQELSRGLNFTISTTLRRKRYGSWHASDKQWSGVVGELVQGNADLGVGDFTMTSHRLDVVDFTLPFLATKSKLFIKTPGGSRVKWSAYLEAFTMGIWITILVIIIISPILLAVIEVEAKSIPLSSLIIQNYLYVWGIFCQQGLCEFPTDTPLRIAYFSIFISALVVSSSYSAALTSYLTVSSATLPFTSLNGFMDDGSYKLIVYQDSSDYDFFATSTDTFIRSVMKTMKPRLELPGNAKEAWEQVCKERVALYANKAVKKMEHAQIKCDVSEVDTGRLNNLAMIMTANNQYSEIINYHIQRIRDNGMLNRLKLKYIDKHNPKKTSYDVVGLSGITPVLLVLACGIFLAFVLLICEQLHCSYLKNNSRKTRNCVNSRKTMMLRCINFRQKEELTGQNIRSQAQWQTDLYNKSLIGYYP